MVVVALDKVDGPRRGERWTPRVPLEIAHLNCWYEARLVSAGLGRDRYADTDCIVQISEQHDHVRRPLSIALRRSSSDMLHAYSACQRSTLGYPRWNSEIDRPEER